VVILNVSIKVIKIVFMCAKHLN